MSEDHRAAILEEIRLIIVEALRNGDAIRPDALARIVAASYPMSGLSEEQIALGIKGAAAEAGVPVLPGKAAPFLRTAAQQ
jgi:hypothetical protein